MFNPVHLQTLRAVLAAGSLSGAAKQLGYTTSAVSQQVAALEKALGVALFERHAQHVCATPAAIRMGEHAREILGRMTEVEHDMRSFSLGTRGGLRLAAFASAAARLLPSVLADLVRRYPEIDLTLVEGGTADLVEVVQESAADLALVAEYGLVPRSWPAGVRRRLVLDEELVVLLPPGHHQLGSAPASARLLSGENWVGNPVGSAGLTNLRRACATWGFEPAVRFHSDDHDVIRGIVRAGMGVALVPALALGTDRAITMRRITGERLCRKVFAVHRVSDPNPLLEPALKALTAAGREFITWSAGAFAEQLDQPVALAG